jgi:hypothetical protein
MGSRQRSVEKVQSGEPGGLGRPVPVAEGTATRGSRGSSFREEAIRSSITRAFCLVLHSPKAPVFSFPPTAQNS